MFESALVIEYLSQSRNKTISGIRMKNSILKSHFEKMLLTWVSIGHVIYPHLRIDSDASFPISRFLYRFLAVIYPTPLGKYTLSWGQFRCSELEQQ